MLVVQDNREGERERGSTYLSGYTFYSLLFSATNQNTYKIVPGLWQDFVRTICMYIQILLRLMWIIVNNDSNICLVDILKMKCY